MTELMDATIETTEPEPELERAPEPIEKVCIVVSKGSLEGVYPALIMANGARMEGIEAELFFTFFGMDVIRTSRSAKLKVATVGNPGMHMPTLLGALPGMSWVATRMMSRQMEKLDIPPVPEFLEMISDSGGRVWACKASVDMFGLTMDDFVPQVDDIITVGEFFERAAGAEIVFT
jgi:peroxiredoxin family protein